MAYDYLEKKRKVKERTGKGKLSLHNRRSSGRNRGQKQPERNEDYELYTAYCLISEDNTTTYTEAIDSRWKKAIEELDAYKRFHTWIPTKLPKGEKAIDAKWVFTTKADGHSTVRWERSEWICDESLNE